MVVTNIKNMTVLGLIMGSIAVYAAGCEGDTQQAGGDKQIRNSKKSAGNETSRNDDDAKKSDDDSSNNDHGPRPEDAADEQNRENGDEIKTDEPEPTPVQPTPPGPGGTPITPPAVPAKPSSPSPEQQLKGMIDAGKLITTVNIDPTNPDLDATARATNWFTSTAKPIKLYVAVDASGAMIPPPNVTARQIASGQVGSPTDAKFQSNGADITAMHSALRVCNKSGRQISLHAGGQSPFRHGSGAITDGNCAQFLVERTANVPGQTYDHLAGSGSPITFQIVKVDPQGKILP